MIQLSNTKLTEHFPYEHGSFTMYLKLLDDSYLVAHLNGVLSIGDIKICSIFGAEDLMAFLKGTKAQLYNASGAISVDDLTDVPTEMKFLEEIIRVTNVDPEILRNNTKFRRREYVVARQLHMMVRHIVFKMSQAKSGTVYGKDHASVLHGIKTILNIRETNKQFKIKTAKLFEMMDVDIDRYMKDQDYKKNGRKYQPEYNNQPI